MNEKINDLSRIRITAVFLASALSSSDIGEIVIIQAELDTLIDEFRSSYADLVTDDEIETSREDVEFFLKLIDSTIRKCRKIPAEKTG